MDHAVTRQMGQPPSAVLGLGALPLAAERRTYTAAEAARYARTSPATARRWLEGYEYQTARGPRHAAPVTRHAPSQALLTFYDLVEVAAIAAAKNAGVTLARIKAAVAYAEELFHASRPLLLERFLTDGRDLFIRERSHGEEVHLNASQAGQVAFPYIADVLRQLDYEGDRPARWWPMGHDHPILVDPQVGFGHPVVVPSGLRTETLVDRFVAGEDIDTIAAEFGLGRDAIEEALRFENRMGIVPA